MKKHLLSAAAIFIVLLILKYLAEVKTFHRITEIVSQLKIPLLIVGGGAALNLFVFILSALLTTNKREEWWEKRNSLAVKREFWLGIWLKSLLVSLLILLYLGAILASVYLAPAVFLFIGMYVIVATLAYQGKNQRQLD